MNLTIIHVRIALLDVVQLCFDEGVAKNLRQGNVTIVIWNPANVHRQVERFREGITRGEHPQTVSESMGLAPLPVQS